MIGLMTSRIPQKGYRLTAKARVVAVPEKGRRHETSV